MARANRTEADDEAFFAEAAADDGGYAYQGDDNLEFDDYDGETSFDDEDFDDEEPGQGRI